MQACVNSEMVDMLVEKQDVVTAKWEEIVREWREDGGGGGLGGAGGVGGSTGVNGVPSASGLGGEGGSGVRVKMETMDQSAD